MYERETADNLQNRAEQAAWPEDEAQSLTASVKSVVFSNEENGYAVLSVTDTDGQEQTVVGTFPYAWPGENITAYGHWATHASYGRQFVAESSERSAPTDERAIFSYLAAGTVRGIGPATAGQIVNRFGSRALHVLEKEPRLLAGVPGISLKKAEQFSKEYRRQEGLKQLVLLLASCGVAPEYAVRVYRTFGDKASDLVRENPYLLTVPGVGAPFGAADMLAAELGISESDPNRIRAGIRFVLEHNERNGHCFIPCAKLCAAAAQQLNLDEESVSAALEEMTERRELIREAVAGQDACYLPDLYEAECETARRIAAMAQETARTEKIPNLEKLIAEFEAEQGLTLALQQREILNYAARHRIVAVTGGRDPAGCPDRPCGQTHGGPDRRGGGHHSQDAGRQTLGRERETGFYQKQERQAEVRRPDRGRVLHDRHPPDACPAGGPAPKRAADSGRRRVTAALGRPGGRPYD